MMKLPISVWRETASFVRVTTKNLAALKFSRRGAEALSIGAPTESPLGRTRTTRIKSFFCSVGLASFCGLNAFATAPAGPGFTYQGRLNDGGNPATGLYDLAFVLHDDPAGSLYFGDTIILSAVPVTNGLFTVQLNTNSEFGPLAFNGQARWLEINVRTNGGNGFTQLSPRQLLAPTPYATLALNALSVGWTNIVGLPAGFADGIDNGTNYAAGPGLTLSGANNQFSVNFAGTGSATTAARSDHNHFGAVWGGNTSFGLGLSVTNAAANGAGLFGQQGAGSGFPYVFGNTAGVWGESAQGSGVYGASGTFRGVQGVSLGSQGSGVYGSALATNGNNYGVSGKTSSSSGIGVYGVNQNATTNAVVASARTQSCGLVGESSSGYGVAGMSDGSIGVFGGSGSSIGVYGTSSNSIGVYGSSQTSDGVYASSISGYGVNAETVNWSAVYASSMFGYGLEAYGGYAGVSAYSQDGWAGVSGGSDSGYGVTAWSSSGTGLECESETGLPLEIHSYSTNNGDSLIEAYWDGNNNPNNRKFRVSVGGEVYAAGAFHPNGADFAELLPAAAALEPGDVLVIGEDGKLTRSTKPNQENVAGVRATKPGLLGGAEDGADLSGKTPLAVVGVVPVKVSAENGVIKPGDKLTTSSTPGHAMKAARHPEVGTVIGKALTGLEGKQGTIQMLVILQ